MNKRQRNGTRKAPDTKNADIAYTEHGEIGKGNTVHTFH